MFTLQYQILSPESGLASFVTEVFHLHNVIKSSYINVCLFLGDTQGY